MKLLLRYLLLSCFLFLKGSDQSFAAGNGNFTPDFFTQAAVHEKGAVQFVALRTDSPLVQCWLLDDAEENNEEDDESDLSGEQTSGHDHHPVVLCSIYLQKQLTTKLTGVSFLHGCTGHLPQYRYIFQRSLRI